ncbi:MAG TPA: hypothetical protein VKM55_01705 [Candidatus Lokiarchaeia archaeon]|nr:hypothetical protein [Candidatus Lokiarchaeia archaeon]
MQKCEFDKPITKTELLSALLMSKMDQVEIAIMDGDIQDAIEILDDAYHLCLDAGEMDMAVPIFEQEKLFKERLGMQAGGNGTSTAPNAGPGNELDASKKRAAMKALLKTMLLLSMRKNMARIQKNKHGY